ncbi:MAG: crotonase/enoyl-CoA hydratase family protein [Thermonemataceae bacterium]|nr:crotonase/enoyl-CoA hydratase family protein [Thermonemataceae bacterium]
MYQSIIIEIKQSVAHIRFNRPEKANAFDAHFWEEFPLALQQLSQEPSVRCIMLSGEGKNFSSGIDLSMLMGLKQEIGDIEIGRASEKVYHFIKKLQASINAVEQCPKPVIACIHGACVGAGVDLASACDLRYASAEAYFSVKEVDMGIIADLGTLQRLPKIIPAGIAAELSYTARPMNAQEAEKYGLVNRVFENKENLLSEVQKIAEAISEKSPLVVRGIKKTLLYSQNHHTNEGLEFIANWNASQLMSKDVETALMAFLQKQKATFPD